MKSALYTYSQVLQLRGDAIHALLQTDRGIAFALKLFLVVSLFAGLGLWLGLPSALRTPTLVERFDQVVADARETVATVTAAVESAVAVLQGRVENAVNAAASEFDRRFGRVIRQAADLFNRFATPQMRLNRLLQQRTLTVGEIESAVQQTQPTPAQMSRLLARANASEADTRRLLRLANLTAEQLAAARTEEQAQVDATMVELQPMLDQLGMSQSQFDELLAQISATPDQVNGWIAALSTTPEAVGRVLAQISATPARVQTFVAQARAEVVKIEPPLGARPSRVIRLGGAWLASPLHYAADWMLFVLALMLVAKSLGGRATLNQHLGAVALSAAPAIFFLLAYAPDLSDVMSAPTAAALHYTGRILALVGVVWCGALLLKAVGVAHGFGLWKSVGVFALTWVVMYVVAPLAVVLATGFLMG
ncbi:MAG: hypothetical protein IAE81_12775 [Caldilineaceae bacterium]|nr:hypothetical protein [Caldilineaceae bacterium]